MKSFIGAIEQYCVVSPSAKDALLDSFTEVQVKKNEQLLRQGQKANQLFFVETGLLRTHYLYEGRDVTSWLYTEGQFATAWYSFLSRENSLEAITALEESTLHAIDVGELQQLYDAYADVGKFGRCLMEEYVVFSELYSKGYDYASAQQRYEMLQQYFPELLLRVKQNHIASLLGISPETLSRLRTKK